MRYFSIIVLIIVGSFMFSGCSSEVMSKSEQQKSFKKFLTKIDQKEQPVNDAAKNFEEIYKKAMNNQADINDVYGAANALNKQYEQLHLDFGGMSSPDGFPDDIANLLNEATQDLSTAYYMRTKGMDSLLKYFDDQKPSEMQSYKDNMNEAQKFMNDATKNLLDAQIKVGIKQ